MTAMPAGMSGVKACGCGSATGRSYGAGQKHPLEAEDDQRMLEDGERDGSREITTLPAGRFGNDKPQPDGEGVLVLAAAGS